MNFTKSANIAGLNAEILWNKKIIHSAISATEVPDNSDSVVFLTLAGMSDVQRSSERHFETTDIHMDTIVFTV